MHAQSDLRLQTVGLAVLPTMVIESLGVTFIPVLLNCKVKKEQSRNMEALKEINRPEEISLKVYLEIRSFFTWPKSLCTTAAPEKPTKQGDCST